jgi:hypothetical protein
MSNNIQKIFQFCLQFCENKPPDVSIVMDMVFNQQPQTINHLENYYSWITKIVGN